MILLAMLIYATPADPVAGDWEGTSLCQLRPSACHDEHVVYHVTPKPDGSYRFVMNKVVGGRELEMGELNQARFDRTKQELVGYTTDRAGAVHQWRFHLAGKHLSGILLTPDHKLFRMIEADRR